MHDMSHIVSGLDKAYPDWAKMQAYVRIEASFVRDVLCHTAGVVY